MQIRHKVFLGVLVASVVVGSGCGQRTRRQVEEYKDPHPLPEEPMVVNAPTIGKYGGRFIFGGTTSPKTFNGMMANEASSNDITNRNLFVTPIDFDNITQEFVPMLAKSWEVSPDGLTWTFHLRRGAKFSDGHPMTSEDVLFVAQIAQDDTLHPAVYDYLMIDGKKFEFSAPDPLTVVVKSSKPFATMPIAVGSLEIMPKHVLEPAFKNGTFASAYGVNTPPDKLVTSGPWRLKQFVSGEKTVLERNPYWFGVDKANKRLPYLDEFVFLVVPDQDAADLKFRAGELDGLDNVKPENYRWYEDNQQKGNYTLYDLGPEYSGRFFWFNLNKVQPPVGGAKLPPGRRVGESFVDPVKYSWFGNPVFRRAVSHAIDRDAIIQSVLFGYGEKAWSQVARTNKQWYNPDLVHYDYNVEESKRLLATLGFKDTNKDGVLEDARGNPITFTLKTNADNVIRVATGNFIKDDLAKVGIKMTLAPVDFNTLVTNIRNDFDYDAILLGISGAVPPWPSNFGNVVRSGGITHYHFVRQQKPATPEEARIDQLMDTIVTTIDLPTQQAAWKEIQTIWNEQSWYIWLPVLKVKNPMGSKFGNAQPSVITPRVIWNIDRVYVK
ncbi:MAG: ABC transporter substrate-binding protein [Vicinamibacterales bacterium]|nr:ABC transporter substrate-binding protein [Vicinamibacterales bacterium]